jgi:hypothetical protein
MEQMATNANSIDIQEEYLQNLPTLPAAGGSSVFIVMEEHGILKHAYPYD